MSAHSQREPKEDDESRKREPTEDSATLEIAPGEPVPPGFEGEINRRAQIQVRYALTAILIFYLFGTVRIILILPASVFIILDFNVGDINNCYLSR